VAGSKSSEVLKVMCGESRDLPMASEFVSGRTKVLFVANRVKGAHDVLERLKEIEVPVGGGGAI
jgi:hypothetical protein